MISIQEAFGWFHRIEKSLIDKETEIDFYQLMDEKIPLPLRERLASDRYAATLVLPNQNLRLEVLVRLGYIYAEWKQYLRSMGALEDALRSYPEGSHVWAVTKWMTGIVQWNLMRNAQAYANWFKAREAFRKLQIGAVQKQNAGHSNFYANLMQKLRVEMACKAEEADQWLTLPYFDNPNLTVHARELIRKITDDINQNRYIEAYEFSRLLAGVSRNRLDLRETAEAWEKIGLAAQQMGNLTDAIKYYKRGMSAYSPNSHQAATIKWMIGIAQFSIPAENDSALRTCQEAIDMYVVLQNDADKAHQVERKEFYESTIPVLKEALVQMRKEKVYR
jgi:tetratricopeptide (TPR) repeat protein